MDPHLAHASVRVLTTGRTIASRPAPGGVQVSDASVHGADVRVLARPADRPVLPADLLERPLARVELVAAYAGSDGSMVRAALEAGARCCWPPRSRARRGRRTSRG